VITTRVTALSAGNLDDGLMLADLNRDLLGISRFCCLDVSLDETVRSHATCPQVVEFGCPGLGPDLR
jgi:hypothetical protein